MFVDHFVQSWNYLTWCYALNIKFWGVFWNKIMYAWCKPYFYFSKINFEARSTYCILYLVHVNKCIQKKLCDSLILFLMKSLVMYSSSKKRGLLLLPWSNCTIYISVKKNKGRLSPSYRTSSFRVQEQEDKVPCN